MLVFYLYLSCLFILLWMNRQRYSSSFPVVRLSCPLPMVVHQTVKDKNHIQNISPLLDHHKTMNPGFEFRLYDDHDIDALIKTRFPGRVYDAYKKINPEYGACRSDFARYCILFLWGGIYLDIKSEAKYPLSWLLKRYPSSTQSSHMMLVGHWPNKYSPNAEKLGVQQGEYMNWVFLCTPGHSVMKGVIQDMTDNIHSGANGTGKDFVLELTGPILFTRSILQHSQQYPNSVRISDDVTNVFQHISLRCPLYEDCRSAYYQTVGTSDYNKLETLVLLQE